MKVICDTTFLDGRDRFEKGEVRVVADDRARYFIQQGWAHEEGGAAADPGAAQPINLNVDGATHAQEDTHG